jgi:phage shock protein PspC (stress-responsive transcriptional regulator)
MNGETMDTRDHDSTDAQGTAPTRRLMRSRRDRVLGGVCGGLGEYFDVDPIIFRIGAVALLLVGGASVLLYLAAWVLVPEEATGDPVRPPEDRSRALTLLGVAVALLLLSPLLLPPILVAGAVVVPLAALFLAGIGIWWLVSGQGAGGTTREVLVRGGLGVGVLLGLGVLAVAGFWAAGLGGAVVSAVLVLGAGVALVVAAFAGRARWLILPALALALPVAFVSAAGINLRGGFGEREYRPSSATELHDQYRVGAGRLVVDLRNAALPPGDTPVSVDVGMGQAVVLVRQDVCVASRSRIGMGASRVFDRFDGGVDLDQQSSARAPEGVPRVVLDARIGLGALQVGYQELEGRRFGPRYHDSDAFGDAGNRACVGASPGGGGGRDA